MSNTSKFGKAIRHPEKIPPYLLDQAATAAGETAARITTWWKLRNLPDQWSLLEDLRSDDDWLLIILDACRYDFFERYFDEYFEGELTPVSSVAHDTFEYARLCWPDYYDDVTYISGAPAINSGNISFEDEWLEGLYNDYTPAEHLPNIVDTWRNGWDRSLGTCPPEPITDATLEQGGSQSVAHYIQPHTPFIGEERELGHRDSESADPFAGDPTDEPIWRRVRSGDLSDERLRELYASNLKRVLPEVCRLVDNSDADRIVITADHGEALGEFGMYAHPRKEHPHTRTVPWAAIDGVRASVEYEVDRSEDHSSERESMENVQDRLRDLGYVSE